MKNIICVIFGFCMVLMSVTSCGNKEADIGGKKIIKEELENIDIDIEIKYDNNTIEKYKDWFEDDHFRNWKIDEQIPSDLLNEISTECLFYDVLPRSLNLGNVVWGSELSGLAISKCYNYIEFAELFNREDAWISAYAFIMDNAENDNMKDINKQWVKDMSTVSINYSEDYTESDPKEVDIEGEKRFQEMRMFIVAQYILTKDVAFKNMPDNAKKRIVKKINEIYNEESELYGAEADYYSIYNFIIEEDNKDWIEFIDSNGLLSDNWKTEYNVVEAYLGENWREEFDYWKKLR